ncbi:DNA-directed RNA polymerase II subunit RPB1 [Labeo rohita]|uniref:DNA-directed RNA polymerase II subunit RPB1 n=1 Tax=Labeo rohita TaxID=84645 RepID=A0ABQ8M585_LABRO|nr:DNA-directed RNA polymerase II subunit RPB1 [Labeo rohita]
MSVLDDATINSLFWIGANYNCPVDLPDTTGLSRREGILWCLESVRPQSRTSPPAVPESRPSATMATTVDVPVGREGVEDSTTHCTAAEGEQCLDLGHLNMEQHLIDFSEDIYVELPACPELPACLDFPPTLPLLSPPIVPVASVPPPLSPDSPAAHPQPTICAVDSPRVCHSPSASWLENPLSPPPAFESWTPPRPSGSTPTLSFLVSNVARRPTSSTGLPRPSGSALIGRRPAIASGLHSSGCASSLPPPQLSVAPAPLRISASASVARALGSALAHRILGVAQDHWLSVYASGSTSTCSATIGRPPGVVSPSSTMAPPSIGSALDPSVSSMVPPSVITALDSVTRPPPRYLSSTEASTSCIRFSVWRPVSSVYACLYPPAVDLTVLELAVEDNKDFIFDLRLHSPLPHTIRDNGGHDVLTVRRGSDGSRCAGSGVMTDLDPEDSWCSLEKERHGSTVTTASLESVTRRPERATFQDPPCAFCKA